MFPRSRDRAVKGRRQFEDDGHYDKMNPSLKGMAWKE
jgi:hypothetical protein